MKKKYVPPSVGFHHHHLHEKHDECNSKDTVSGVQYSAGGPAHWPTHTAHCEIHATTNLWGEQDRMCVSVCFSFLIFILQAYFITENTKFEHVFHSRSDKETFAF